MTSPAPTQLIRTGSNQGGNCCCVYCPDYTDGDCDLCPPRLIQAPAYAFDCGTGGTPPCGGSYAPPLFQVPPNQFPGCTYRLDESGVCTDPLAIFSIAGGCGETSNIVVNLQKWHVLVNLNIGPFVESILSLFVKLDAPLTGEPGTPGEQCLPTGTYSHIGTWIDTQILPPCDIFLTAPVGDLQVIAV